MALRTLALCAGVGGLELGVDLATGGAARVVCYVEREAYAAAVLVARMEAGDLAPAPVWSDLDTFDAEPWGGVVDLVTAGFPCQPFSPAGKRLGLKDERWLWPSIARIIRVVRPGIVFLENSSGIVGPGLGAVLGDLAGCGFDAEWSVLRAADVGAPHLRQRSFVVATHPHRSQLRLQPRRGQGDGAGPPVARVDGSPGAPVWPPAWTPAPDFRRVDDGVANRVDRIRATGNGVVPQQAALAWRELWGRLV